MYNRHTLIVADEWRVTKRTGRSPTPGTLDAPESVCAFFSNPSNYYISFYSGRYLFGGFDAALLKGQDVFILHWDDDEGTSRSVQLDIWSVDEDDYDNFTPLNRAVDFSVSAQGRRPSSCVV